MRKHVSSLLPGLLALSLLTLPGCSKEADPDPVMRAAPDSQPAENSVLGRWALTSTSGGIMGGSRAADPNQRAELIFRSTGEVDFLFNGAVTHTLPYAERLATTYLTGQQQTFLFHSTYISQLSANNLTLVEDANDGFTYQYVRRPL